MHTTLPTRYGLAALVAALSLLLPSCNQSESSAGDKTEETSSSGARRREVPRVRVTEVVRREMVQVLRTTSTLESDREIQIFPRMTGVAQDVFVEEGDRVAKGEVLAQLDDRDQVLAVSDSDVALKEAENAAARSELAVKDTENRTASTLRTQEQTKRDYERDRDLFEGREHRARVVSQQAVETSLLAWENARSEHEQALIAVERSRLEAQASKNAVGRARVVLERADLALEHMRLVAPFDGVIAERSLRVGKTASTGESAFVLTDIERLRTVFMRPQEELQMFARATGGSADGNTALTFTATAEAYPGRVFGGYIERISPTIDASSGQFRITARLNAASTGEARVLPGMLMRLFIVTERHPNTLVVPKRALRREGERRYLLVLSTVEGETTVRRVNVSEGFDDDDHVEITATEEDAIAEGDTIILVGSRDIQDGDMVTIDDGKATELSMATTLTPEESVEEPDSDTSDADGQ